MSKNKVLHCAVPGCNIELPSSYKIPICDYHSARLKEGAGNVGAAILTAAGSVALFVKANGPEFIEEHGPEIVAAAKKAIKKL